MADVLLVHVREDDALADAVGASLERSGLTVARGESVFDVGDEVPCVLVVWSEASTRSTMVRDVAIRAQREGKLVAARLAGAEIPLGFSRPAPHELADWSGDPDDPILDPVFFAADRLVCAARLPATTRAPRPAPPPTSSTPLRRPPPPQREPIARAPAREPFSRDPAPRDFQRDAPQRDFGRDYAARDYSPPREPPREPIQREPIHREPIHRDPPPPRDPAPPAPSGGRGLPPNVAEEALAWKRIEHSTDPKDFLEYLQHFGPDSLFSEVAQVKLDKLVAKPKPPKGSGFMSHNPSPHQAKQNAPKPKPAPKQKPVKAPPPEERPVERYVERPPERPPQRERPQERERPPERYVERAPERYAERPPERPPERYIERAPERPVERPVERPIERPVERYAERPVERPIERPIERPVERPVERYAERPPERYVERAPERAPERMPDRVSDRVPERVAERYQERTPVDRPVAARRSTAQGAVRRRAEPPQHDVEPRQGGGLPWRPILIVALLAGGAYGAWQILPKSNSAQQQAAKAPPGFEDALRAGPAQDGPEGVDRVGLDQAVTDDPGFADDRKPQKAQRATDPDLPEVPEAYRSEYADAGSRAAQGGPLRSPPGMEEPEPPVPAPVVTFRTVDPTPATSAPERAPTVAGPEITPRVESPAPPAPKADDLYVTAAWLKRPSGRTLGELYPDRALRESLAGKVMLDCAILLNGKLNCSVKSESPTGKGFGTAAMKAAESFVAAPRGPDGKPAYGQRTLVPITFKAE